jgi:rhodanese-related sulfurtransferase
MLRRLMNLPLTVASKAARAFQEREDARAKEKYGQTQDPGAVAVGGQETAREVSEANVDAAEVSMSPAAVRAAAAQRPIAWVDVRGAEGWARGHIRGALHMPMAEVNVRLSELAWDQLVIAVCDDGVDSARAVAFFRERGMEDTFALAGGLAAWTASGGELVP